MFKDVIKSILHMWIHFKEAYTIFNKKTAYAFTSALIRLGYRQCMML